MNLKIRLYIEDDNSESFMGIGVLWLLKGIQSKGSIRKAAQEMNMSYTKACQILNKLEKSLNEVILERQKGGNSRVGTYLSEYGEKFLKSYETFNFEVESFCQVEYKKFMSRLD